MLPAKIERIRKTLFALLLTNKNKNNCITHKTRLSLGKYWINIKSNVESWFSQWKLSSILWEVKPIKVSGILLDVETEKWRLATYKQCYLYTFIKSSLQNRNREREFFFYIERASAYDKPFMSEPRLASFLNLLFFDLLLHVLAWSIVQITIELRRNFSDSTFHSTCCLFYPWRVVRWTGIMYIS